MTQNKITQIKHIPTTEVNLTVEGKDRLVKEVRDLKLDYQLSSELISMIIDYHKLAKELRALKKRGAE